MPTNVGGDHAGTPFVSCIRNGLVISKEDTIFSLPVDLLLFYRVVSLAVVVCHTNPIEFNALMRSIVILDG